MKPKGALLAFGGLLAGLGAAWLVSATGPDRPAVANAPLTLVVGWSFIGSGLLSWHARPRNRLGPIMVGTGFAWFASVLQIATDARLFTLGEAVQVVYLAGVLYLLLSFPSGLLHTAVDRSLVAVAIALVTIVQAASLVFSDSRAVLCNRCPANLLEVTRHDDVANLLLQFQRLTGLGATLGAIAVLAVRWHGASRPQRRAVAPLLAAGTVSLAALSASIAADILGSSDANFLGTIAYYALATVPVAVLVVFLGRRLARGAVAGLVVELGESNHTLDLRQALARALGDPSIELGYWFPGEGRYVGADGSPITLPSPGASRVLTRVAREGQAIAALIHDPALEHNAALVDSVCAAAGLSLENERLKAELRARLAELQASRGRLIEATDAERRRIERDLHDGTQQRLVSIAITLGLLDAKLPPSATAAKPILQETRHALTAAISELRELSQGIHPTILAERGLEAALEELCQRVAIPARLDTALRSRLPDRIESAAYFFVSEALANTVKHAHASDILVAASHDGSSLRIRVVDDGIGGASLVGGSGLRGLTDRVEALGGRLTLSSSQGRGTTLSAEIPCE